MVNIFKAESKQMSDSMRLGALLALAGGFLDAYTFLCRGNVFANAQTGNIVMLGASMCSFDLNNTIKYLFPVFAFIIGTFICELTHIYWNEGWKFHWRQLVLVIEMIFILAVAFLPEEQNHLANVLISFSCALQLDAFRKIRNCNAPTTMCTGNLRSAISLLCSYKRSGDTISLKKSLQYFLIVILFVAGGGIGAVASKFMGLKSIFICFLFLLAAFLIMFINLENKKN